MMYRAIVRKLLPWILSLFCLVAALFCGALFVNQWLSGEKFHALLEQKSSEALQAHASFGPLKLGWFEIFSPHFEATGKGQGALHQLTAEGIHSRLIPASLLQGVWHIEEISLEKSTLHLGSAHHSKEALANDSANPAEAKNSLPGWIPTLLVIDKIHSGKADVFIELPSGKSLDIFGARIEAYPEGGETRVEGYGGILKTPFLPDLRIGTVRCRMQKASVELTGADLSFPEGGKIEIEGSFPDTQESMLSGRWNQVPIKTLVPLLSRYIVGSLDGTATVQWDPAGFHSAEGTIKSHDLILTEIPMMNEVAQLTRMDAFHHLLLQKAQASFLMKPDVTKWSDIVLESQSLIKLTGSAETRQGGAFSGSFQLGLSSPIVTAIPGASMVFSKDEHDGYFWTPLQVGGTLSHPTEDLTPRIIAAVMSNAGLLIQQGVKQGLEMIGLSGDNSSTSGVTNSSTTNTTVPPPAPPVDQIKQGGGALIDVLGGFLK